LTAAAIPCSFSAASGVALVTAASWTSNQGRGEAHPVDIASGKLAIMNARPTRAGLNRLNPSPPKITLPIRIENAPPISACHAGTSGGRVSE
jgi:hypothetical protein